MNTKTDGIISGLVAETERLTAKLSGRNIEAVFANNVVRKQSAALKLARDAMQNCAAVIEYEEYHSIHEQVTAALAAIYALKGE